MRKSAILTLLAVISIALGGCGSNGGGSDGGTIGGPVVGSLQVLASNTQLATAGNDTITLTAIVKDSGGILLEDVDVSYAIATGSVGALVIDRGTTDTAGTAVASLSAAGSKDNRTIRVNITAGGHSQSVDIQVIGTTVSVTGASTILLSNSAQLTLAVKDSAGNAISNKTLSVTSAVSNRISNRNPVTGPNGEVNITVWGDTAGNDTLTVQAVGATPASFNLSVLNESFTWVNPPLGIVPEVNVGAGGITLTVNWPAGAGTGTVTFAASRGTLPSPSTVSVDGAGNASITLTSNASGFSSITATSNSGAIINAQVLFVATTPTTLTLQASPSVIATTQVGSTPQTSTILATVRDATGNLVKNQEVRFQFVDNPTEPSPTGDLSPPSSITNALGQASSIYTSTSVPSSTNGVVIRAWLPSNPAIQATTSLTVGGEALFITLGTGNEMSSLDVLRYKLPYGVMVTDSAGNPQPNKNVSLILSSQSYLKGSMFLGFVGGSERWIQTISAGPILNEDVNQNGVLDLLEDTSGNCQLDPGNVATFEGSNNARLDVTTDASGFAQVNILYFKSHALWVNVKLRASTFVSGTESTRSNIFTLPILASDVTSGEKIPPNWQSPYNFDDVPCIP